MSRVIGETEIVERVARRVLAQTTHMIFEANHRSDARKTDPKVGGHPAACASSLHLLTALHLQVRRPEDVIGSKPHASPLDHLLHHHLGLMRDPADGSWMTEEARKDALHRLRAFSKDQPVFQSYHAESDPDSWNFLPSGSVGIPGVVSLFASLAWRFARDHGFDVPKNAHFYALIGDSEFREGSLLEALPEATERGLNQVTWIVDYNRQNLDGTRIIRPGAFPGTDADRIGAMARVNGWKVIQLRHGRRRQKVFGEPGGELLRATLESKLSDYELQMLLYKGSGELTRERLVHHAPHLAKVLSDFSPEDVQAILADLGGHDFETITAGLREAREDDEAPVLVVAHTLKGFGLPMVAAPGNHSQLPTEEQVLELLRAQGLDPEDPYALFAEETEEEQLLTERGEELRRGVEGGVEAIERNLSVHRSRVAEEGSIPESLGFDLRLTPVVSTQWMAGQAMGKLTRIANHGNPDLDSRRRAREKDLDENERRWKPAAELILTLAPDVGTSTNLSPSMDGGIYGPCPPSDLETGFELVEKQRPAITPAENSAARHLRFEITEANAMSALGAFGKLGELTGVPLLPVLTIYDFFLKRALDQLYYNCYWGSSFLVISTPSGVTLSSEGAQHSWKSDLQLPNQICWEPCFAIEVDWILSDAIRRHAEGNNRGRSGVILRAVTRGIAQKELLSRLRRHRVSSGQSDEEILRNLRENVLRGGYFLVDYRDNEGYEPGDNVVHLFCMGALTVEALEASDRALESGIFVNVIVVTSPDLLVGSLGREDDYRHLRETLGINADLNLTRDGEQGVLAWSSDWIEAAASRIPIVSVHDGEPGLLDNIGSLVGVRQEALAVRRASKSGALRDIYGYHEIDEDGIERAIEKILTDTAEEKLRVSADLLAARGETNAGGTHEASR